MSSSEEANESVPSTKVFETVFLISEVIIIVLFAFCTDYKAGMGIRDVSEAT